MTLAALIVAAVALAVAVGALVLTVVVRAEVRTVAGSLARHRESHANRVEERRALRHGPAPTGPATEQAPAVRPEPEQPDTVEHPAPDDRFRQPPPPLPRPGSIPRP